VALISTLKAPQTVPTQPPLSVIVTVSTPSDNLICSDPGNGIAYKDGAHSSTPSINSPDNILIPRSFIPDEPPPLHGVITACRILIGETRVTMHEKCRIAAATASRNKTTTKHLKFKHL
jgi:hypothetical protein